jgi:2Fe-2S ferredoxin
MVALNVIDRTGTKHKLNVPEGSGLMEALRDNNLGVEAICGGCCSCATCHVFIPASWKSKLPERSEDENDLLVATSSYRPDESRLSCQINMTKALDGIEVTVASAD